MMVNLKEMIANGNSFEVAGRINRLNESFRSEAANVHQQEVDLINQGQANGQSAKTILNDIINFRDQQSELFKVSTGWEGSLWSDADNYSALVARSSDYINAFAWSMAGATCPRHLKHPATLNHLLTWWPSLFSIERACLGFTFGR